MVHLSCGAKEQDLQELLYGGNFEGKLRAISLQSVADNCKKNISSDVSRFFNVTQIIGYVIDNERNDLVLIGAVNQSRPKIYFEDFIVALRNAWHLYYTLEDSIRYYSSPGCSIDPDPKVISKLQEIGNDIYSSRQPEIIQTYIQQWKSICGQLQQVRIFGIPFETRFAKVMIDADYMMKSIADGSLFLEIDGFWSLTDMRVNLTREYIKSTGDKSLPTQSMNRFWFYPGDINVGYTDGIVTINKTRVTLLTEQEYLTNEGQIQGTGNVDSLAKLFASKFSDRYDDIAKQKPIYSDLENLFKFVVLATAAYSDQAIKNAGINLDYFLYDYPVRPAFVNHNLPGKSNVKQLSQTDETPNGKIGYYYWFPTCGGVNIDVKIKRAITGLDNTKKMNAIRETILESRPHSAVMYWDVSIK